MLACLSGMAGHALYGMAPCFGHTGVTFDDKMIDLVPAASEVILRPPEAVFWLCFEAVVLLEVVKCFLCACAATHASREATCSPPASAGARREAASIYIN